MSPKWLPIAWAALPIVLWALLGVTDYSLHEADSVLYSGQAVELAARPFSEWLAPQWWGLWETQGLFKEHPPFLLWVFALVVKAGIAGQHGAIVAHFAFLLVFAWMGARIGRSLDPSGVLAPVLSGALMLMPIMLQYQLRANLETPATAMLLVALAPMIARDSSPRGLIMIFFGTLTTLLFKGLASVMGLMFVFTVWLTQPSFRRAAAVMCGVLSFVAIAVWFESAYQARTGEPFWSAYWELQRGYSQGGVSFLTWFANMGWYLLRASWYCAPWGVLCLVLWKKRPADTRWLALTLPTIVLLTYVSLFARRAERYVFAAYPCLAIAGAWALVLAAPRLREWLAPRLVKLPASVYVIITAVVAARVLIGRFAYLKIRLWR